MKRGINKIKLFENLDKETKEKLSAVSTIKKYKKGELLYSDKEKINTVYFVLEGVASLYKPNPDNTKKVVFLFGEGYVLNEVIIYENITSLSCEFLSNAKLLEIPREKFVEILETSYPLAKGVIESLINKNRIMSHQLKNISNSITVDRQIAFKLWKLGKDFGIETPDGIEINFDLSITLFAEMLGAKRETVSRQVKVLSELGLISLKRKRFTLLKYNELLDYFHGKILN
ncbi:Crp/Fnr family transcriptional regulator [uncultured Fusobacterium sp.]|uniref:Crp/Fnr family transcriptional regulator n=1 Tax=uncultured Fusobacterium sp. TaxID=159267 RepID=UPI0025E82CDD|nr:Crp/Fnr family transcriptional regulator [uncultured Fusobacterium sp.]